MLDEEEAALLLPVLNVNNTNRTLAGVLGHTNAHIHLQTTFGVSVLDRTEESILTAQTTTIVNKSSNDMLVFNE